MFDDYTSERGTGSGSASSSEHAIGSDGGVVINLKESGILSDFADKEHEKMQEAAEKMKIPSDSDSDDEQEMTAFIV